MDTDPLPATSSPLLMLINMTSTQMSTPQIVALIVACFALIISGFLSGCEISYFSLTDEQIDDLGESTQSSVIRSLLSKPEKLLATILIGNNFVNVTIVILTNYALGPIFDTMDAIWSFILQTILLTFFILLFGEILPKLYAKNNVVKWANKTAMSLYMMSRLLSPLASMLARSTTLVNRVVAHKPDSISATTLTTALQITNVDAPDEKEMLEGILHLGQKTAGEIMTPRVDMTDIEISTSFSEVMKIVTDTGFARIPVYEQNQDSIKGVLYSRDLLPHIGKDDSFEWQKLIREPYFVAENQQLNSIFEDFRRRKIHMAIVVDEYGGTQGLVTLEDVLEEVVGEIDDEYDDVESFYKRLSADTYVFDGRTPIQDFFSIVGLDEEDYAKFTEDAETLAGMILTIKGDFPKEKEPIVEGRLHFLILEIEQHRITEVRVKVMPE